MEMLLHAGLVEFVSWMTLPIFNGSSWMLAAILGSLSTVTATHILGTCRASNMVRFTMSMEYPMGIRAQDPASFVVTAEAPRLYITVPASRLMLVSTSAAPPRHVSPPLRHRAVDTSLCMSKLFTRMHMATPSDTLNWKNKNASWLMMDKPPLNPKAVGASPVTPNITLTGKMTATLSLMPNGLIHSFSLHTKQRASEAPQ